MSRWLGRYVEQVLVGVERDAPRSGRPLQILPSKIAEIVEKTTQEKPAGCTHWSTRTMAPMVGVSASSVGRIWRAHGLQPHRVKKTRDCLNFQVFQLRPSLVHQVACGRPGIQSPATA